MVPLLKSGFRGAKATVPAPGVVDCTWRFEAGTLRFVANVGSDEFSVLGEGEQVIWASGLSREALQLPPWTGMFLIGAPQ